MCMNVYVCEALTANLGLGAISSLVYSYYYYYYYICKALRANPRLGAILSLRYYYYYINKDTQKHTVQKPYSHKAQMMSTTITIHTQCTNGRSFHVAGP